MGSIKTTVRNRQTGVESPLTEEQFEKLKKDPSFKTSFEIVEEIIEPDEVTKLKKKAASKQEESQAIGPIPLVKKPKRNRKKGTEEK